MAIETILLPARKISDAARQELQRACVTIHTGLLWGELSDVEIVELHHFGERDGHIMFVWDVPREIQISSLNLYLHYHWSDKANGYVLELIDEPNTETPLPAVDEGLGDLDDHPF